MIPVADNLVTRIIHNRFRIHSHRSVHVINSGCCIAEGDIIGGTKCILQAGPLRIFDKSHCRRGRSAQNIEPDGKQRSPI